jgi:arabinosyltransferase B/arabinosyltransferase C
MTYAPLHQKPGWTVAAAQMQALGGRPCGLGNAAFVMTPTARNVGAPVGADQRGGDFQLAADDPAPLPAR